MAWRWKKFIDSNEDRKQVDELFQKALQDYLCKFIKKKSIIFNWSSSKLNYLKLKLKAVPIWLEYIQFSIGGMGEENGIENVRQICEKAISFAGLHVTKGHLLWEVYREFESAVLEGFYVINNLKLIH